MSRHTIKLNPPVPMKPQGYSQFPPHSVQDAAWIAYGYDHAVGYFIQAYAHKGGLIVDIDSVLTGLNNGAFLTFVQKYHLPIPQEHLDRVGLDLPID